jgi:hypothetical protein
MSSVTTVNYPTPILVNGYSCKNCTDVDEAKKHIDPAHPKDGPYGINAKDQPGAPAKPDVTAQASAASASSSPAVTFGGALAGLNSVATSAAAAAQQPPAIAQGQRLNVLA